MVAHTYNTSTQETEDQEFKVSLGPSQNKQNHHTKNARAHTHTHPTPHKGYISPLSTMIVETRLQLKGLFDLLGKDANTTKPSTQQQGTSCDLCSSLACTNDYIS